MLDFGERIPRFKRTLSEALISYFEKGTFFLAAVSIIDLAIKFVFSISKELIINCSILISKVSINFPFEERYFAS